MQIINQYLSLVLDHTRENCGIEVVWLCSIDWITRDIVVSPVCLCLINSKLYLSDADVLPKKVRGEAVHENALVNVKNEKMV